MSNMENYPLIIPVTTSYLEHWELDQTAPMLERSEQDLHYVFCDPYSCLCQVDRMNN